MRYSATTGGFYPEEIDYPSLPADLVEITPEYHAELIAAQEAGQIIAPDADGVPQPVTLPQPTAAEALAAWRATSKVSRFQARAALYAAGKLDAVEAVVAATGGLAAIAWADASEFRRNSPTIAALASGAGLSDADLDALFVAAAQITA